MFNKYKIKKKKKLSFSFLIIIFFLISLAFASYGYSLFSDTLKITGTANILDNTIPLGNSTYSWSITKTWYKKKGNYFYQISMPITNLDGDVQKWEISFDVPDGCVATTSNIWQASEVTITGNTIKLVAQNWNGFVQDGSKLTLDLTLPFKTQVDFNISNVIFNGKVITYVPTGSSNNSLDKNTDNSTDDNTSTDNNTSNNTGNNKGNNGNGNNKNNTTP